MSDDLRKELEGMVERILKFTDPNEDIRAVICRVYLDGYEAGMARTVREYEMKSGLLQQEKH